ISEALPYIDPWALEYLAWAGVIAAVHDAFAGTEFEEDALSLIEEWADGEEGEVEAKWHSFEREYAGQPTTLATVYYFAQQGGWVNTNQKKKSSISDSLYDLAKG